MERLQLYPGNDGKQAVFVSVIVTERFALSELVERREVSLNTFINKRSGATAFDDVEAA